MNAETVLLSKWWRSDSCKHAFERAARKRQERLEAFRRQVAERKEELEKQIWEETDNG